ncbi:MAG: alpha/beta hydrolase [Pseudomonadota bacterium]
MKAVGLAYQAQGDAGPLVVCLHGIGGDASSFAPQLHGLSGACRVISLSLPGYGGSDPLEHVSFEGLSDAVLRFMDALGAENAHLCGHSIGGMIALETACRAPDRVVSLALIGTTSAFGGRDESFKDAFVAARLAPLDEGQTLTDLAPRFVPEIMGPDAPKDAVEAATRTIAAVPEGTYRAIIRCLVTFNRREDVKGVTAPACLIAGALDQNAPARTMARMAQAMPQAEFHEIAGAGHLINLEAPEETNRILGAFYRSTS